MFTKLETAHLPSEVMFKGTKTYVNGLSDPCKLALSLLLPLGLRNLFGLLR